MVKKYDAHGFAYHEPPYTEEEQNDLYRRMSTVVAFTRPKTASSLKEECKDTVIASSVSKSE